MYNINMKNELEVYSIRTENDRLKAVITDLDDIVTSEKMKSYIKVDGISFFTNLNGKKIEFTFDEKGELTSPDPSQLKLIKKF